MSLADAFIPIESRTDLSFRPPLEWRLPFAATDSSESFRERAYCLARQELPDAPVEDVMCRAEKIASYLKGEASQP